MTTTNTTTTYKVNVNRTNGNDSRFIDFGTFKKAYAYYLDKCNDTNCLDNAEQTTGAEMNLSAGGRGYDYIIELEVIETQD